MSNLEENFDIEKLKDLISQLENDATPLTKTKANKVSKNEIAEPKNETIKNVIQEKPIQEKPIKQKQPVTWTTAKAEAFKKMQEARRQNVEASKRAKKLDVAKVLLNEIVTKKPQKVQKPEPEPELEPELGLDREPDNNDDDSSSSEEEIIIKKAKKSAPKKVKPTDKKKKTKTIIIQSDSETEDDDNDEIEEPKSKQRTFKSARNKKSVIKVHNQQFNPDNFFV